jgi:hypothetical protein
MNTHFSIDWNGTGGPNLLLVSGLQGYATNGGNTGLMTTFWCFLCQDAVWRIESSMYDLAGWDEVGSLRVRHASEDATLPSMIALPAQWTAIKGIDTLLVEDEAFCTDTALAITNRAGEELIICCGANPYALVVQAPFFKGDCFPEFGAERYRRRSLV